MNFNILRFPWKPVEVQLGTISQNSCISDGYQCAKFHACIKKCTILLEISSYAAGLNCFDCQFDKRSEKDYTQLRTTSIWERWKSNGSRFSLRRISKDKRLSDYYYYLRTPARSTASKENYYARNFTVMYVQGSTYYFCSIFSTFKSKRKGTKIMLRYHVHTKQQMSFNNFIDRCHVLSQAL